MSKPKTMQDLFEMYPDKTLWEIEREVILDRLKQFNNDKVKTAHSLDIMIKTLYNKLHEYEETNE